MNPSPPSVSPEEQEQLLQTIEMFEVIVQANPQDTQSIEILRDAYARLGMRKEMVGMAQRLAETYSEMKQYTAAIQEYELILKYEPDNVEIIAAMGEVEDKMYKSGKPRPAPKGGIDVDYRAAVADTGTLMATSTTQRPDGFRQANGSAVTERVDEIVAAMVEDGNDALAKFLIQHRLATEDAVTVAMEMVQRRNKASGPDRLAASLIEEIVERGGGELEVILSGILDRTKFAYVPIEYYDVDRQIARMLPEHVALGRLMVPFDVMSRTVMIATANPFDSVGKSAAQQLLDYNIQWHLASPQAITRVLQQVYKISPGATAPSVAVPFPTVAAVKAVATPVAAPAASPVSPRSAVAAGEDDSGPLPDTSAFRLAK